MVPTPGSGSSQSHKINLRGRLMIDVKGKTKQKTKNKSQNTILIPKIIFSTFFAKCSESAYLKKIMWDLERKHFWQQLTDLWYKTFTHTKENTDFCVKYHKPSWLDTTVTSLTMCYVFDFIRSCFMVKF